MKWVADAIRVRSGASPGVDARLSLGARRSAGSSCASIATRNRARWGARRAERFCTRSLGKCPGRDESVNRIRRATVPTRSRSSRSANTRPMKSTAKSIRSPRARDPPAANRATRRRRTCDFIWIDSVDPARCDRYSQTQRIPHFSLAWHPSIASVIFGSRCDQLGANDLCRDSPSSIRIAGCLICGLALVVCASCGPASPSGPGALPSRPARRPSSHRGLSGSVAQVSGARENDPENSAGHVRRPVAKARSAVARVHRSWASLPASTAAVDSR